MSDRRCPECFEILECPLCDPSITHMVHDAEPDGCRHCPQQGHTTEWHEAHYPVRSTPAAPKEDDRV